MADRPLLSVVGPVFNEEAGLGAFYERCVAAADAIVPPLELELVLVDDGSTDGSRRVLREIAARDPRVRVLELSRNFGHQLAITAGVDAAAGDAVVVIDTDLQDPPEVMAAMVERWRAGYKVVYGQRTTRSGEGRLKLLTARVFYRLINWLSDVSLPVDAGDFRLLDRAVVDTLKELREANRYLRGLVAWVGYEQTAVEYERDARFAGSTNFTFRKMARFAMDGVTSFSEKPLRIATQMGLATTAAALMFALTIVVRKGVSPDFAVPGWASLMTGVALLGGIQLLSVGVLGEYVGRIYRETKNRPLYVVAEEFTSRCHHAGERDHQREDGEAARGNRGSAARRELG